MNIVVIGLGEVGRHISRVLSQENHNVTVIDSDAEIVGKVADKLDVRAIVGHGGSPNILKSADVANSDLLIAVTSRDEVNILTSLIARNMGAPKVIARVDSSEYLPNTQGTYKNLFGIDMVISPEILSAIEISKLIGVMQASYIADFAEGQVELMQLVMKKKDGVINIPLKDVKIPEDILVTAIVRNNELIIPSGETAIQEHDSVLVIGKTETISEDSLFLSDQTQSQAEKVVILGGGEIGYALANLLEEMNLSVIIIEWNQSRCKFLSENLKHTLVINGDGSDIDLLKQEKVGETDVFVAAAKRDEVNLMSGLLAKELGCKKTIAIVHRPDYLTVYEHLGLDATISPRRYAANQILRHVRSGEVLAVSDIELGKGEILEFAAISGSKVVGTKLKDLRLPKNTIIGAIAGDRGVIIPDGNDEIFSGDKVIIFTIPKARSKVENLFRF